MSIGRNYKISPALAAVAAAATDERVVYITAAANNVLLVRKIEISQEGNNDNETFSAALAEITTPGGGDAYTPVAEPGDAAASFTCQVDNGTAITGTTSTVVHQQASHGQGRIQMVPTDVSGVLAVCTADRPLCVVIVQGLTTNAMDELVVDILVEEIG